MCSDISRTPSLRWTLVYPNSPSRPERGSGYLPGNKGSILPPRPRSGKPQPRVIRSQVLSSAWKSKRKEAIWRATDSRRKAGAPKVVNTPSSIQIRRKWTSTFFSSAYNKIIILMQNKRLIWFLEKNSFSGYKHVGREFSFPAMQQQRNRAALMDTLFDERTTTQKGRK